MASLVLPGGCNAAQHVVDLMKLKLDLTAVATASDQCIVV